MICTWCKAQNGPEDHRCSRCGRRLEGDEPRRHFPVQTAAAAPALDAVIETSERPAPVPIAGPRLVKNDATDRPAAKIGHPVQAPLFPPQEVPRTMTAAPTRPVPMSPAPSHRRKAARAAQPSLFDTTCDGSRTLPTSVEAAVYCDAEVAGAGERSYACAIDCVCPLIGFALFFGGFFWIAGAIQFTPKTLPWFGALFAIINLLYRGAFCIAGIDTPGTRAAGLRLLTFDGRVPQRRARVNRILGGIISVLSLGIGLAWGLLDEEHLTWHDHISRTFPTPRD